MCNVHFRIYVVASDKLESHKVIVQKKFEALVQRDEENERELVLMSYNRHQSSLTKLQQNTFIYGSTFLAAIRSSC